VAPDITTATGRTFITDKSNKRRFLIDWVRASVCSLASSSHNAGHAFTTTTAWLMALPSSLMDDCLLAATWDYAGTTRHATPRRRTPSTNFQHLWRQTSLYGLGNKSQAPLSQHTVTRLPDNLDRTFHALYASKCSIIISIDPTMRSGRHLRFPACFNIYATISVASVVYVGYASPT
jgi:hypothetical protein